MSRESFVTAHLPALAFDDPGCGHAHEDNASEHVAPLVDTPSDVLPGPRTRLVDRQQVEDEPNALIRTGITAANAEWLPPSRSGYLDAYGTLHTTGSTLGRGISASQRMPNGVNADAERRMRELLSAMSRGESLRPMHPNDTRKFSYFPEATVGRDGKLVPTPEFAELSRWSASNEAARLADITQVYPAGAAGQLGGHVVTSSRASHGIDAAESAARIAMAVGINWIKAITAAAGHDGGHLGGGHATEGRFDHILTSYNVEMPHPLFGVVAGYDHAPISGRKGFQMQMSIEVYEAWAQHSWPLAKTTSLYSVIVSITDRIAYMSSDIVDVMRLGLLPWDQAYALFPETMAMLRMSPKAWERMGQSPTRYGDFGKMIREAFTNDVIDTYFARGFLAFSAHTQAAMGELRNTTSVFTFQNPAHMQWQKTFADVSEQLLLSKFTHYRNIADPVPAFYLAIDDLGKLTELQMLQAADELDFTVTIDGYEDQSPLRLHQGPTLERVKGTLQVTIPEAPKRLGFSPMSEVFGVVHSVGEGRFRTDLTVVECLDLLAAASDHGPQPLSEFDDLQLVEHVSPSQDVRYYRPARSANANGDYPQVLVPGPTHPRHQSFLAEVRSAVGVAISDAFAVHRSTTVMDRVANTGFHASLKILDDIGDAQARKLQVRDDVTGDPRQDSISLSEGRSTAPGARGNAAREAYDAAVLQAVGSYHRAYVAQMARDARASAEIDRLGPVLTHETLVAL